MFSFAVLALGLVSCHCVSGILIPREAPSEGWMTDYFETYEEYYARYLALSCETKHGSVFFEQCCRPLLTAESLSNRPPECDPAQDDDLPYCDDEEDNTPVITATLAMASEDAPLPTDTEEPTLRPIVAAKFSKNSASANVNTGGYATYYYQNGVAGACGIVHSDWEYIAAIDGERYGNLGERSSLCGRRVQIVNNKNGRSVTVTIADACPTCLNSNCIDLSVAAFQTIASLSEGVVPISWSFI